MEVYVKESLHVLDYKDHVVDSIFLSDDHMTPGYAYDITITEANTGYSDLKFNMPNMIIDEEGNQVHNPKLKLLTPLVKLRYHRQVYYMGDKPITVKEPQGYGDVVTYVDKVYSNKYPENIVEEYVMDYVVQPVDRKRDVLKLTTAFTAIDYPRFNLSKKKVGLTIAQDTLAANPDWSLFKNEPIDVKGTIHYELWTAQKFSQYSTIEKWDPANADSYPLTDEAIYDLVHNTATWPYGLLGTAFYWPITSTGRFEGTMYTKGGYLVLQLYDFLQINSEGVSPEKHVDRYGWEWSYLEEVDKYLAPNNALNYLRHILHDTNWSVAIREDNTPDVDIVNVDVPNPDGSAQEYTTKEHTCNINISNGNCYNAITAVCQGLQLYPVYNCEERTVALRAFSGKNYGLTYRLGLNLQSNGTKLDGEKVITKLYVTGGKDYQGDQNINIGEAERSYFEPTDNPDERDPWNPNDPEYIIKRSPYGTNYILNFKWMYDNKWITKEEILDLYNINQQINDLNKSFMIPYTEDRLKTMQAYNDAINEYDLKQGEYISTLNSMMNKYYKVYGEYSKGTFYAFHKVPQGTHTKVDPSDGKTKNYIWIAHCKECGLTKSFAGSAAPTSCGCGHSQEKLQVDEVYIPVYKDFSGVTPPPNPQYPYGPAITAVEYEPYLKGDYLKLLTTLDGENKDWTISNYEEKISIITPIEYIGKNTVDDREYKIDNVFVKASSSNIQEWNDDIVLFVKAYGEMLDARDKIDYCLTKIEELEIEYNKWKDEYDGYHAEIQKKYGDYIIEGNYTNNEQPYVGLLFNEGVEASDKFSIPEVTYNLDVIDSSGLIEYRMPQVAKYTCADCGHTSLEHILACPKCNGQNIIKDQDTYNDLVHMLHSAGQIVPKAGDYVKIYDEPMGLFGVPGMITEISRTLDKPVNNKIKLDTGYTDDEELVGNIINATNTVLNHADIYARTAILKADGTIDSTSISKSLDNPNASVSIIGTNGNMLLTSSYLRFTNPADPTRAMKYSGTGIFSTTTLNENGVATEWQKMITPTGINATYLNAGQIDTKNINIMSGMSSKLLIDQYGLVIKNTANKSAHVTTFDSSKASKEANYTRNWGETNNISSFVGVDTNNNALMYTRGFLVAENGSNIAGWVTSTEKDNKGFFHLVDNTTTGAKDLWLSPDGINGTVNGTTTKMAIYANGNFGVSTTGTLYATGAQIKGSGEFSGKIVSNSTSTIGGTVDATLKGLSADAVALSADGLSGTVNGHNGPWAIYSKGNFGVTTGGHLYATGAKISGDIYATNGTFNGVVNADGGSIKNLTATNLTITGDSTFQGTLDGAGGTFSGNLNAAGGTFGGSLSAATGTFKGELSAATGTFNGTVTAGSTKVNSSGLHAGYFSIATESGNPQTVVLGGLDWIRLDSAEGAEVTGSFVTGGHATFENGITIDKGGITITKGGITVGDQAGKTETIEDIDIGWGSPINLKFVNGIYVGYTK